MKIIKSTARWPPEDSAAATPLQTTSGNAQKAPVKLNSVDIPQRIALCASKDPELQILMEIVASGEASQAQRKDFWDLTVAHDPSLEACMRAYVNRSVGDHNARIVADPSNAGNDASLKRLYSAISDPSDPAYDSDDSCDSITDTCDDVRRKITKLINSGEMKVIEFQRACKINSSSYGRFMKLRGPSAGESNQTYDAAYRFFKQRKESAVKEPSKKKTKKDKDQAKSNKETSKKQAKKPEPGNQEKIDISTISLPGSEHECVSIYDTCDEIRRKIAAHLRQPNITQASFLRDLVTMFPDPSSIKLQYSQLKDFQAKKGALAGNATRIYYAAYCFFEKERLAKGRPKTKKRVENEEIWGWRGGIDRKTLGKVVWCGGGRPVVDRYGLVRSV